jgi:predicted metal-dependent hydrolase
VSDYPQPTNNDTQQKEPARQDVDVLLDVSELEVDRLNLTVRNLRAHVSVLAELASLLSLQVGVDARLEETELEIEGVRAKLLLKVRLEDIRAILREALQTVAEHPQILRILTRALDELVTERIGDALDTLQGVLESLEDDGPVDVEALKGRLEDARDTLQEVLDELGERAQGERPASGGVPEVRSSSAAEEPSGSAAEEPSEGSPNHN